MIAGRARLHALVITMADINIMAGAIAADTRCGVTCPVVVVAERLQRWTTVTVSADGTLRPGAPSGSAFS